MILVVGSGVAGLSCARAAAEAGADVTLVTPGAFDVPEKSMTVLAGGNTALAQGGIAAAVGPGDSASSHAADTVAAGVGLVDEEAARVLTSEGASEMRALISHGFPADRRSDGALALGLEAAHGRPRIVHAGEDRTGAVLHAFLLDQVQAHVQAGRITIIEGATALSLLCDTGAVTGVVLTDDSGRMSAVRAEAVVLATGGYSGLFSRTSGHPGARGEGVVIAARAGALVADLEFVQFHPTALIGTGFLVSEAVRGAGAVLRDAAGRRFMEARHPAAELAPRDVVARSMHRVMRDQNEPHVWLDATEIERDGGPGTLERRFPTITAAVRAQGVDWARDPVPVAPAAHYTMGGIVTDLDGRTTLPGLYAAGEVASSGVHGANRLASNSLLEGMVFAQRAAAAAVSFVQHSGAHQSEWALRGAGAATLAACAEELPCFERVPTIAHDDADAAVRQAADTGLGIERDAAGLQRVGTLCAGIPGPLSELASMVAASAYARTESRGAHQRSDYPEPDPLQARRKAWVLPSMRRLPSTATIADSAQESLAPC